MTGSSGFASQPLNECLCLVGSDHLMHFRHMQDV
jgi:hypothetical protein